MVLLNTAYTTASGRIFRTLHYLPNDCICLLEDVSGNPLPKMHVQHVSVVDKLIKEKTLRQIDISEYHKIKNIQNIMLDIEHHSYLSLPSVLDIKS